MLPAQLGMLPMSSVLACRNWEEAASAAGPSLPDVSFGEHASSSSMGQDNITGIVVQRKKRQQCAAACIPCAKSKSACDNNRPCKRCMRQNKGKLCFDKVGPASKCVYFHFCLPFLLKELTRAVFQILPMQRLTLYETHFWMNTFDPTLFPHVSLLASCGHKGCSAPSTPRTSLPGASRTRRTSPSIRGGSSRREWLASPVRGQRQDATGIAHVLGVCESVGGFALISQGLDHPSLRRDRGVRQRMLSHKLNNTRLRTPERHHPTWRAGLQMRPRPTIICNSRRLWP
jgi:hypothetical protein